MTTNEHLQKIKAKCQQLLDIAEKRTPGRWHAEIFPSLADAYNEGEFEWAGKVNGAFPAEVGSVWLGSSDSFTGLPGSVEVGSDNATFIASCAGPAEAGWKATIAAIDDILENHDDNLLAKEITAAWPIELLDS